jgi:hypothetical protein
MFVFVFAVATDADLHSRIIIGVIFVTSCVFAFFIKRVRMDDKHLYISSFTHEIEVPLSEVMNVTDFWWINPHAVMIKFHKRTPFGERIFFAPQLRNAPIFGNHSVVMEIKDAVERAKNQEL